MMNLDQQLILITDLEVKTNNNNKIAIKLLLRETTTHDE